MSIIIPEENKMNLNDLRKYFEYLCNFINENFLKKHIKEFMETLGKIEGYLLISDKKNYENYFNLFFELNYFDLFKNILLLENIEINYEILKSICFLVSNIQNSNFIKELYSSKIINNIIVLRFEEDELTEFLINFMKTLSLKLTKENISFFYNHEINDFPLLTNALSFYNSKNPMVRNVVRNIILQIIKIEQPYLRKFLTAFPFCVYYPYLIFKLREIILTISNVDFCNKKSIKLFKNTHDDIIDLVFYISDLLNLNIESINFILINTLLNDIILPIMRVLISKKAEKINSLISLYILTLLLYSMKNKFIIDSITILLFNKKIDKNLLNIIKESKEFGVYSDKFMKSIDFMIKNTDFVDVNDDVWKSISEFMKNETGLNLADGKKEEINSYRIIENYISNQNNCDCIDNEILNNIQIFCYSKDDNYMIIINTLIYIIFDLYNHNKNQRFINLQSFEFFNQFDYEAEEENNFSLFHALFYVLTTTNSIRVITSEIILSNIKNHISYIKNNMNDEKIKSLMLPKLKEQIIKKIEEIKISQKQIHKTLLYEYSKEAYEIYVKNINNKINDLITLPWVLIPLICYEKIDEYPLFLYPSKNKLEFINNFIQIYYLFDLINEINDNKNELFKLKEFPLIIQSENYNLGKKYNYKELGDDKAVCEYIIFKGDEQLRKTCYIILSMDTFYLGENLNGNTKAPSDIKIIKKIPLRRLEIKNHDGNNKILDIFELGKKENIIVVDCFETKNTINVNNFLIQNKNGAIELEYLLVISFLDDIVSKIK